MHNHRLRDTDLLLKMLSLLFHCGLFLFLLALTSFCPLDRVETYKAKYNFSWDEPTRPKKRKSYN